MNCRPGILAFIVDLPDAFGLNGHVVKLADAPAFEFAGLPHWRLEEPLHITLRQSGINRVTGELLLEGSHYWASEIPDRNVRPIGKPGDNDVDEMVAKVGPAPMTLTELLRREEIAS